MVRNYFQRKSGISDEAKQKLNELAKNFQKEDQNLSSQIKDVSKNLKVNPDESKKAELEKLHQASFGWALSCCRHNRVEAEEVLQIVYLKILQGKLFIEVRASCEHGSFQ